MKSAFDPQNRLNHGKICPPEGVDTPMMKVDAVKRGTYDRQIPLAVRQEWRGALECNGNGLCFNFDANSPMCPSMKISMNRIHSPKDAQRWYGNGYACWLTAASIRFIWKRVTGKGASLRTLIARTRNSWHARKGSTISRTKSKRRCPAVWHVKRVPRSARSKLTSRNFALASCNCTTRAICARC